MPKRPNKKSKAAKNEAKEKIKDFFEMAEEVFKEDKALANDYVRKARRVAMKFQLKRLPTSVSRRFCKHCHSFLVPGENLRIRTREGHVVYYCLECKKFTRYPYRKKK